MVSSFSLKALVWGQERLIYQHVPSAALSFFTLNYFASLCFMTFTSLLVEEARRDNYLYLTTCGFTLANGPWEKGRSDVLQ